MKILHTADLHIGKRVNEFSMLVDQKYILEQILSITDTEAPDAVILAGDLYDRSIPVGEAVELLDFFLTQLSQREIPVFAVSGNHDSPERLDFGRRILCKTGIHMVGSFSGTPVHIALQDKYGPVHFYLLPFLKPAMVSPYYPNIDCYDTAVRTVVSHIHADFAERNILVAHQFVINGSWEPERTDSESISVGGVDQVDASAFDGFDYVALGHLHRPQAVGRPGIRYAGSPLKYSFSEAGHAKSVTVVDLEEKGYVKIKECPLSPLHDLRQIKGPISQLTDPAIASQGDCSDYIRAILTDQGEVADAIGKLRAVYPNLMRLEFERQLLPETESRTAASGNISQKGILDLFAEFYEDQHGTVLSEQQKEKLHSVLHVAGGEDE